ncbi:MAG: hypothetical protein GY714_20845 [Desulfobacterales bacterium]|nr:hypothetical protein [Desulfobacterales bacterium]
MKKIKIRGKDYIEVHERIKEFRSNQKYKGWSLTTNIIKNDNGIVLMKASIKDAQNGEIATGYAQEKDGSTYINKTSYIENCETSAWGRALGCLGIGVDTSIASAEEVGNAIIQQEQPPKKEKKVDLLKAIKKGLINNLEKNKFNIKFAIDYLKRCQYDKEELLELDKELNEYKESGELGKHLKDMQDFANMDNLNMMEVKSEK